MFCLPLFGRWCKASDSPVDPPPADDSSSSGAAASSSYYSLPWEDEQPKQLPANYANIKAGIDQMDNNQLQTALGVAIAAEDYVLASRWVAAVGCCNLLLRLRPSTSVPAKVHLAFAVRAV
jgi:hypothetical protein